MDNEAGADARDARIVRRSLLKKAAAAGAVAWTVPMVIESVTNPAGALTCAPGNYHVVYQTTLQERTPTTGTGCNHSGTNVTAASVGLSVAFSATNCNTPDDDNPSEISHIASTNGNCRAVVINVNGGCDCTITSVYAHVHNRGPNNCPIVGGNYCWSAGASFGAAGIPLLVNAGGIGTSSVTVQPNYTSTVCSSTSSPGIHWGSPNVANGYLVVNVNCTG